MATTHTHTREERVANEYAAVFTCTFMVLCIVPHLAASFASPWCGMDLNGSEWIEMDPRINIINDYTAGGGGTRRDGLWCVVASHVPE